MIIFGGLGIVFGLVFSVSRYAREQAIAAKINENFPRQRLLNKTPGATNSPVGTIQKRQGVLRFAIAPVISPESSYVSYKDLVDFVALALKREGKLITRSSYEEINQLIRDGACDVALICTYSYIKVKTEYGAKPLVAPVMNGVLSYQSYIVVKKGSAIRNIEELQGKTFGFADEISTSGWIYLGAWLKDHGFDPMTFFSERILMGSHDSAIFAVASNEVTSAAVHSIVFNHMPEDVRKRLQIIHRSLEFGMPPLVTPAQTDERLRKELLKVLLSLHESERGQKILSDLKIDRFEVVDPSLYGNVQDLFEKWNQK